MELDIFNPTRQLRRAVLFWLSIALAFLALVIAYLNTFHGGYYLLAATQVASCLFSLYVAYTSYKGDTSLTIANSFVYILIGVVALATFVHPIEHGSFIWSLLFPVLFYLILGRRNGFVSSGVGFTIVAILVMHKTYNNGALNFTELSVNFSLAYLCIWLASHILEVKRKTSETSLGQLASRDALTGVYNRHALIHNFERYRSESAKVPLSLLILDLDYFKSVNDQHGHDAGDRVLVQTAALIDSFCDEHLVYRIGGEEFCIALHNTEVKHAMYKAEIIRIGIEQYTFNDKDNPIKLTASIGIYQCDHYKCLEDVLREADKELYKAKSNGRNQVMVCNQDECSACI
ncbi:diguanylate cyclase [Vibrio xuii]|nr:diguanylate cyclase [Vibrio xuii]